MFLGVTKFFYTALISFVWISFPSSTSPDFKAIKKGWMKDDFAWGRHCESQNKDEIFYGALLAYVWWLFVACSSWCWFLKYYNCCIFLEQKMKTRSQRGRDRLSGSGWDGLCWTCFEWNVYELWLSEWDCCYRWIKKWFWSVHVCLSNVKMWCNIPSLCGNLLTQNRCRCARRKPLMKLPQK